MACNNQYMLWVRILQEETRLLQQQELWTQSLVLIGTLQGVTIGTILTLSGENWRLAFILVTMIQLAGIVIACKAWKSKRQINPGSLNHLSSHSSKERSLLVN